MRKEVYVLLIVVVILVTIFSLNPSLKHKVSDTVSNLPTMGLGPAADIYKTTVIVYKGEVQLSDFDKKGMAKPIRMIHEGQSAVVKAKRKEAEPEETSRILGVARFVFPHIIDTFYKRVEVWTAGLPPGQASYMLSQQDISAALNKNLANTVVSDIQIQLDPQGARMQSVVRAGPVQFGLTASGIVSVDEQHGGQLILRLRDMKAGKVSLPDAFLREMERAFSEAFGKGLPVRPVSIQYQSQGVQITLNKVS